MDGSSLIIPEVEAVIRRSCGCLEYYGTVSKRHPIEEAQHAYLIDRVNHWYDLGAKKDALLRHVRKLDPDVLWAMIKGELSLNLRPQIRRCKAALCVSPFRDLACRPYRPAIAGGATVFPYAGKSVTTNRVHGAGTEPLYIGMGLGTGTHAVTDTALFNPSAEARITGTGSLVTTNANNPNDTWQTTGAITASGTRAVTEVGCFDVSTAAPATTTNGAISSSGTLTLVVTSATGFPGSGSYDIEVDDNVHTPETMIVTAGAGTTSWTVTRGGRGSTAQAAISTAANVVGGTTTTGGNAMVLADFSVLNLINGDSFTPTIKVQYT